MNDEAQTLPSVSVVWNPPQSAPQATAYAARLLERALGIVAVVPSTYAYATLLTEHASTLRQSWPYEPGQTTAAQDLVVQGALHDFASALLGLVKRDLDRKLGLDLATTLVPLLADRKETK